MSPKRPVQQERLFTEEPDSPSTIAVQSWLGPYNEGVMEAAEGRARVTGPCGDTMEITLRIQNEQIVDSRFRVTGCAVSRACASAAAALAKGKGLEEAWDIDEQEILRTLKMVPDSERHCALLARDTLRQALENYIKAGEGNAGPGIV